MVFRRSMIHFTAALGVLAVTTLAIGQEEEEAPPLNAVMKVKFEDGKTISARDGKIPLELKFTNSTDRDVKFTNADYRFALLNKDGEHIINALVVTIELRDILLKGGLTVDKPSVSIRSGKIKAGEEYYLVVSMQNLTGLVKFKPTE